MINYVLIPIIISVLLFFFVFPFLKTPRDRFIEFINKKNKSIRKQYYEKICNREIHGINSFIAYLVVLLFFGIFTAATVFSLQQFSTVKKDIKLLTELSQDSFSNKSSETYEDILKKVTLENRFYFIILIICIITLFFIQIGFLIRYYWLSSIVIRVERLEAYLRYAKLALQEGDYIIYLKRSYLIKDKTDFDTLLNELHQKSSAFYYLIKEDV